MQNIVNEAQLACWARVVRIATFVRIHSPRQARNAFLRLKRPLEVAAGCYSTPFCTQNCTSSLVSPCAQPRYT